MNKKANKKNRGFSLVELIIVIAIMAILAGVLAPQFVKYLNNSKRTADIQTAQSLSSVISAQYAQDAVDGGSVIKKETFTEITNVAANAALISAIGDLPKSKVDPDASFYYYVDANGKVTIYAGDTGKSAVGEVTELCPKANASWK